MFCSQLLAGEFYGLNFIHSPPHRDVTCDQPKQTGGSVKEQIAPDDWEEFHAAVIRARSVKEEAGAFGSELFTGEMEEVELRDVLCLQENIGRRFRNRKSLESLIRDLNDGKVDPMTTPWLVSLICTGCCVQFFGLLCSALSTLISSLCKLYFTSAQ